MAKHMLLKFIKKQLENIIQKNIHYSSIVSLTKKMILKQVGCLMISVFLTPVISYTNMSSTCGVKNVRGFKCLLELSRASN